VVKDKGKAKLERTLVMVPMFRDLPKRHLRKLAGYCEVGEYMSGSSIVKKGEPGDAFYVVLAGQAKVTSGRTFLGRLLPGDHFGEIAVLDGGMRSATVTSETPMTLLILRRAELLKALKDDPDLARHMMVELAKMIRRVNDSISQ
jgi:CRP-like cAMP-binding protein